MQKINASLAVALVREHLSSIQKAPRLNVNSASPTIIRALEDTTLAGRCETRREKDIVWYCDVAHTPESVVAAAEWFNSM